MQRNLSGIFFRSKLPDGTWGNVCIEDLSRAECDVQLQGRSEEWKDGLIHLLCETINQIGEECNILKE